MPQAAPEFNHNQPVYSVSEVSFKVKRIVEESFRTAKEMIATNRDKLEMIANSLLEYETLDGVQVEEIVKTGTFTPPPKPPADMGPMLGAPAGTPLTRMCKCFSWIGKSCCKDLRSTDAA